MWFNPNTEALSVFSGLSSTWRMPITRTRSVISTGTNLTSADTGADEEAFYKGLGGLYYTLPSLLTSPLSNRAQVPVSQGVWVPAEHFWLYPTSADTITTVQEINPFLPFTTSLTVFKSDPLLGTNGFFGFPIGVLYLHHRYQFRYWLDLLWTKAVADSGTPVFTFFLYFIKLTPTSPTTHKMWRFNLSSSSISVSNMGQYSTTKQLFRHTHSGTVNTNTTTDWNYWENGTLQSTTPLIDAPAFYFLAAAFTRRRQTTSENIPIHILGAFVHPLIDWNKMYFTA